MNDSPSFVALLRGINVGGRNRLPMAELRVLSEELGWRDVRTYIQSGNLIFGADGGAPELEGRLEAAIEAHLGRSIPVIVRGAADWPELVRSNPFPEASESRPGLVMLALSKTAPRPDAAERLQELAGAGERVTQVGGALWIDFVGGSGRSRLTPAVLDRLVGSPVTTRNWRTVLRLQDLAGSH